MKFIPTVIVKEIVFTCLINAGTVYNQNECGIYDFLWL